MRRFVCSIFVLGILLTACGGGSSAVSCEQRYWDGTVGTCLPADWVVIDAETLRQRGVPSETIIAFQSGEPVSGQFPTVAITRERMTQATSPAAYSDASIRAVSALPAYERIDMRDVTVDGEAVQLHVFSAKPVSEEPTRRYYQISTTVGNDGFTATAVVPVSIESAVEDEIVFVLEGVTYVAPSDE